MNDPGLETSIREHSETVEKQVRDAADEREEEQDYISPK